MQILHVHIYDLRCSILHTHTQGADKIDCKIACESVPTYLKCVYVCMHVYVLVHVCVYVCTYVCMCVRAPMCVWGWVCMGKIL